MNDMTKHNRPAERAELGREIKKRMIDLGISQREVARRVPMRYQYLNRVLKGEKSGDKYWPRIMEVLDDAAP